MYGGGTGLHNGRKGLANCVTGVDFIVRVVGSCSVWFQTWKSQLKKSLCSTVQMAARVWMCKHGTVLRRVWQYFR